MGVLKGLVAATGLLLAASCWSPVFDADVSLAALTAGKLTLDDEFTAAVPYYSNTASIVAVASRSRHPTSVLLASLSLTGMSATVMYRPAATWSIYPMGNYGFTYDYPVSEAEAVTIHSGLVNPAWNYAIHLPTVSHGVIGIVDLSQVYPTYPTNIPGVFAATDRLIDATTATLYTLADYTGNSTPPVRVESQDSNSGQAFGTTFATLFGWSTFNGYRDYGWMAYRIAPSTVYFTHHERVDGKYRTDVYDSTGPAGGWTRSDRVVALLSTGELLTRDGSYYNVCSPSGTIKYTFPAGTLKYSGEFDVSGTFWSRFTQVLSADGSHNSSEQTVRLYSIKTADLKSLK